MQGDDNKAMWSVQRSFAHAPGATLGRQKGPEVNVTIEYLLFTPEVAAGAAGPLGLSRRLPLLCFLHGIGDHVGNWLRHQPLSMAKAAVQTVCELFPAATRNNF